MHIQIGIQMSIDAAAQDVWAVLARDFARIGRWATAITESDAAEGVPAPEGAVVGGRVCANSVPGFGDVQEEFTNYDEEGTRFSYKATKGMPWFVKKAENNWMIRAVGPNQTEVEARGELVVTWFSGLFLAPLLKLQFGRTATRVGEELKYYVENGRPHPRKLEAQRKLSKAAHPES